MKLQCKRRPVNLDKLSVGHVVVGYYKGAYIRLRKRAVRGA